MGDDRPVEASGLRVVSALRLAATDERPERVVNSEAVAVSPAAEPTLKTLIRDELRAPVARIVREVVVELVHEQLNGNGHADVVLSVQGATQERRKRNGRTAGKVEASETRTCQRCGRAQPLDRFEPGRRTCRRCRNSLASTNRKRRLARTHVEANGDEATSGLASSSSQGAPDKILTS